MACGGGRDIRRPLGGEVPPADARGARRDPVRTLRTMHYAFPTFHRGMLDALAALDAAA